MKRRSCLAALLAAAAAAAIPAPAKAACEARFQDLTRIGFVQAYDAFAAEGSPTRIDFEVVQTGDQPCAFAVGADRGQSGGNDRRLVMGSGTLAYQLYANSQRIQPLEDFPAGSTESLLTGQFRGASEQHRLDFFAVLPEGQIVPSGSYSDSVTFTLYELDNGVHGRAMDIRRVQVTATVSPVASIEAVVNGQRSRLTGGKLGTLDFGRMTTGQRLGFSLEIAGNMGYDVMLESENGGKFQGSGQSNNDAVPYRLYLGGLGFDAAQPVRLPFQPATSMGRTVNIHQIDVEIGDVSRALAGSYSDNLIVTVTTR